MTNTQSWDWTRVIFDHVHLRVTDLQHSRAFYAAALEPLGIPLLLDTPELVAFANLALSAEKPASTGVHIAFSRLARNGRLISCRRDRRRRHRQRRPRPARVRPLRGLRARPRRTNLEAAHRSFG